MSANTAFQPVNERGWRRGFSNLLRHENATWWGTRRWWINILIWLVIANGTLFAMLSTSGPDSGVPTTPEQRLAEATMVFMVMAGIFGTVGAIISMQGSIIDEKKSGTAAWILSKPASRPAFVLAKLVANAFALTIIVLVVQSAIMYVQIATATGHGLPIGPFVAGIALLALHMLFYITLTLMLGTIFSDRGPVVGIPIGFLFASMFLLGIVGDLAYIMPWLLVPAGNSQGLAVLVMLGQPLPTIVPVIATAVWSVIFTGVALWRFQRDEF
ncbi:MAG: ABC transporter permease [Anaerolineae bacterium]|nr:ABC transporter permease [Anaerolineae bacterium]